LSTLPRKAGSISDAALPPQTAQRAGSLRYAWFVVAILTLVYVLSFIDRQIFALLVIPLRRDLGMSDTQISLLMGFSFAVFYTFFGIPIGRLADTHSRRAIIATGLVLWSGFTTGCGFARSFPQMFALRTGVGVGEAALSPAAYSLITDYFPRERLATAISVYSMGIYLGSGLAYMLGGLVVSYASARAAWDLPLVGSIRSWQLIFLIVGLPGVLLALLLAAIREPPRTPGVHARSATPLREVVSYILQNRRTFFLHNVGFGLLALSSYGAGAWIPEYFRRHFHWTVQRTGLVYGLIVAVFGCLGIASAGRMADFIRSRGRPNANLLVGACVAGLTIPVSLFLSLSPSPAWATAFLIPAAFLAAAPFGIAAACIQQMMPPTMRAQASALYLFIINLVGLGLGPTAVAASTQYIFRRDDSVHFSLALVTCISCVLAAGLLYACLNPFLGSLEELHRWHAARTQPCNATPRIPVSSASS
jgi:MFS family permease